MTGVQYKYCPISTFFISMKKLFTLLLLTVSYLFITSSAFATTSCQPIYGGGESCSQTGNIILDKTVQNPSNGLFVDNLNINDPKYSPGQTVNFNITIRNTENKVLTNIEVKDVLPQYVSFVSGPGNFDKNTNTLTFNIGNFPANEARTYTVQGKIADQGSLPFVNGTTCVVNQSVMHASNGQSAQDNSQFCVQLTTTTTVITKGGLTVVTPAPITTTPSTGPEMLPLLALIPSGIAGFFLRRKSKSI
jgi:uncharacterized repeat protein (TIGR01451 family)